MKMWHATLRFMYRHLMKWMSPHPEFGVAIQAMKIECRSVVDYVEIKAEYAMAARDGIRSHLTLDLSEVLIDVVVIECSVAERVELTARDRLVVLRLLPDTSWNGAEIKVVLRWQRFATNYKRPLPDVLLIPDGLPRLVSAAFLETGAAQPAISVDLASPSTELQVTGVQRAATENEFLRVAVIRTSRGQEVKRVECRVVFSGTLKAQLDEKEKALAVRIISTMRDFISDEFGYDPTVDILVASPHDLRGYWTIAGGPWLLVTREGLGFGAEAARQDASLAIQMASIWWGTGCRVSGPDGREVEYALRSAVGLRWVAFALGYGEASRNAARLKESTGPFSRFGWTRRIAEGWRPWVGAFAGCELAAALNENPGARSVLRQLTRETWGQAVPSEIVRQRFAQTGVELARR